MEDDKDRCRPQQAARPLGRTGGSGRHASPTFNPFFFFSPDEPASQRRVRLVI